MKYFIPVFVLAALSIGACKKKGCTDNTATNYNANANKNDGSCQYTAPEEGKYALHALLTYPDAPIPLAKDVFDTFYVKAIQKGHLELIDFLHCSGGFTVKHEENDGNARWVLTGNGCDLITWECYYGGGVPPSGTLWVIFNTTVDGTKHGYSGEITKLD